jgi:hypothetical protein
MSFRQWHTRWLLGRRYRKTWSFMEPTVVAPARVLDIGTRNAFSVIMEEKGLVVSNTKGEDLDDYPESVAVYEADVATAFEIFEHLLNPLGVLRAIKAPRLIASIPLSLWFDKAYRNHNDRWDQHYHEFEDWQFDWLLEKAGWKIIRREKWTGPILIPGIRPLLRAVTPRYYIIEAVRV